MESVVRTSTGLPGLDQVLEGLRRGDNVVWKVDCVEDYAAFAEPFSRSALQHNGKLVYFRFAEHRELVDGDSGATIVRLQPEAGFEAFITHVHQVIAQTGHRGSYVFDMFSDLVRDLYSERMLGNFFTLTCPHLHALESLAYFAVLRNYHSYHAIQPMTDTSQLLIEVYRHKGKLFVHPLKVNQRYSHSIHLFHAWEGDQFVPITDSGAIAAVATSGKWPGLRSASYRMVGMWDRRFMQAEETLDAHERGDLPQQAVDAAFECLVSQLLSRDERVLQIVRRHMTLADLIHIWKRVVGSGMVGGKTVGMLLARAILEQADARWTELLEPHDSFFIGSDIFYTFLARNQCWWIRQKQKKPDTLLDGIDEARRLILEGQFPDYIISRFSDMLDYFGQSPIIVRSSSLLEDAFGNAFAGKYESVFCANQGTPQQRLEEFLAAVRVVYASAMSEDALRYRAKREVLERDEQMALLVQRVSGKQYGDLFYPQLAGVGLSVNPFVWHPDIDPEAGMVRIVFGLGTRAVARTDDDYTRIVALNAPQKRPEGSPDELRHHSQQRVDYIDLQHNQFGTGYFDDVVKHSEGLAAHRFGETVQEVARRTGAARARWVVSLDRVLADTPMLDDLRSMLRVLRDAYGCDVDVEFTVNFEADGSHKINLLQCRPLQTYQVEAIDARPTEIDPNHLVLEAHGAILGCSRVQRIDRLVYVVPRAYGQLRTQDRFSVARLVGKLVRLGASSVDTAMMLLGPGRWGTEMPELGVPVSFSEINAVAVLCEIDAMHEGLTPELSLGTHFFNELVEMNIAYVGFFRSRAENVLNEEWLSGQPNRLAGLIPSESKWHEVVRVLEAPPGRKLVFWADHLQQQALLYEDDI